MKKLRTRLLALCLSLAMLFTFATNALAAPSRNTGKVKYLSEVALIEAKDKAEADGIFAELKKEENGGFEAMIDMDLNEGGKSVYLVYKSSLNVDDAITDLAVMNMYGNYNMGSYERILAECMKDYEANVEDYRVAADEFAANYRAGDVRAQLAYRQLNYYFTGSLEEGESGSYWKKDKSMGDYMLSFPEDNEEFANILFKGNLHILTNIRSLLSMGVGTPGVSLAQRVADKTADASVYENAAYYEDACILQKAASTMKKSIYSLESELEHIRAQKVGAGLTQEDKDNLIKLNENSLAVDRTMLDCLKAIPYGTGNLGDYIMNAPTLSPEIFFPMVAAMTEGELALARRGQLRSLLIYDVSDMDDADVEQLLAENEKELVELCVYYGTDTTALQGTVAVTGDALLTEGSTGRTWVEAFGDNAAMNEDEIAGAKFQSFSMGVGGASLILTCSLYMYKEYYANRVIDIAQFQETTMIYDDLMSIADDHTAPLVISGVDDTGNAVMVQVGSYSDPIGSIAGDAADDLYYQTLRTSDTFTNHLTSAQLYTGIFGITIGVILVGVSIYKILNFKCADHVEYSAIPDNMVNTVTGVDGERFINYRNVPSYRLKDGKLAQRANDLNAYNGNQWVSLYYTKSYEAGHCLTTTADLIAEESVRTGYSGIHLFGATGNYNLNSYSNRSNAPETFLSFKFSTNKKSAEADVPNVIGSSFAVGAMAISGFTGVGIGIALMAALNSGKSKKEKEQ